jgi:hypothetical protein
VANLGATLATAGYKVAVIDMDTGLRNLDLYLGLENNVVYDVNDVMQGVCRIKQALIKDKSFPGLHLMAGAPKRPDGETTPLHMKVLCRKLTERFDYVIVDGPAGIDDGQSIRIREKGEPGINGGPRGDLLVEVRVASDPNFVRQDMDIFSNVEISFAQAALGGDLRVKTVDGEVIYTVRPGTQSGTRVRLKGKGVPSVRNKDVRGDHYVTLTVVTPTRLSDDAKEALRRFDELSGNSLNQAAEGEPKKKKKTFREKMKEAFDGD